MSTAEDIATLADQTTTTGVQRAHGALCDASTDWTTIHAALGPLFRHLDTARQECHRLGLTSRYERLGSIRRQVSDIHDQIDQLIDPIKVETAYLAAVPADRPYIRDDDGEPLNGQEFEDIATSLVAALAGRLNAHDLEALTADTRHGIPIQYTTYFMNALLDALNGRQVPITPTERDIVLRLMDRRDDVDPASIQRFNVVHQPPPTPPDRADADGRDDHPLLG